MKTLILICGLAVVSPIVLLVGMSEVAAQEFRNVTAVGMPDETEAARLDRLRNAAGAADRWQPTASPGASPSACQKLLKDFFSRGGGKPIEPRLVMEQRYPAPEGIEFYGSEQERQQSLRLDKIYSRILGRETEAGLRYCATDPIARNERTFSELYDFRTRVYRLPKRVDPHPEWPLVVARLKPYGPNAGAYTLSWIDLPNCQYGDGMVSVATESSATDVRAVPPALVAYGAGIVSWSLDKGDLLIASSYFRRENAVGRKMWEQSSCVWLKVGEKGK